MTDASAVLQVRHLTVGIRLADGRWAKVVDDLSFQLDRGATLGIVGESGSGKTMASLAIMGLLPSAARVLGGEILLDGEDLLKKSERQLQSLRGSRLSMILQDPMTALDPSFTIGSQLAEPLQEHRRLRGKALEAEMVAALQRVNLSASKSRLNQYPHQLSGGMRQRVTSAIALAGEPDLLIADEPTTALDVMIQARYLRMLRELQRTRGFALLLIAHDLALVRHQCERVLVMYSGQAVESGAVRDVFEAPQHPYTRALIGAIPVLGEDVQLESIEGQVPDISDTLPGCRFQPRCQYARAACSSRPALTPRHKGHLARCWGTEKNGWLQW